jgi:pentatricopeptide repeat protein
MESSPAEDSSGVRYGCFGPTRPANTDPEAKHSRSSSWGKGRWWGGSVPADDDPQEELGPEGQQDALLAHIQDALLGLDLDSRPAPPEQLAPKHERKISWTLSGIRRVMPSPVKAPSAAAASDAAPAALADRSSSSSSSGWDASSVLGGAPRFPGVAAPSGGPFSARPPPAAAAAPPDSPSRPAGNRGLWRIITSVGKGDKLPLSPAAAPPAEYTVEGLSRGVLALKPAQGVLEAARLVEGLHALDSRAVAALLKELSKAGAPHRAAELFDYLRSLPDGHELSALADLYTYTTVISQCGGHQHIRRALELVAEMRGRGIQCNVHTYSALMSVCVKCKCVAPPRAAAWPPPPARHPPPPDSFL